MLAKGKGVCCKAEFEEHKGGYISKVLSMMGNMKPAYSPSYLVYLAYKSIGGYNVLVFANPTLPYLLELTLKTADEFTYKFINSVNLYVNLIANFIVKSIYTLLHEPQKRTR